MAMSFLLTLSKYAFSVLIFLGSTFLSGEEWKKEVQNCGEQVCFFLVGENDSKFLGSSTWAKEAVAGGKEMIYEKYFYEGVPLLNDQGDEIHIHKAKLENTGLEWMDTAENINFADYVWGKYNEDPSFAKLLDEGNVRYFSDQERQQTQVHWVDGALWQIGLDNKQNEIAQVLEGEYAFVLGRDDLFIALKGSTEKGRIHHSSFFRGGPVRSAGKITVGANGLIISLSNSSGHYCPGDQEIVEILAFLQSKMSENDFQKISVQIK